MEEEAAALAENIEEDDEEESRPPVEAQKGVEIMHKSHKEFYRAVAKQWGITCKMSDHCRCLDCQVRPNYLPRYLLFFSEHVFRMRVRPKRARKDGRRFGGRHAHVHLRGDARKRMHSALKNLSIMRLHQM